MYGANAKYLVGFDGPIDHARSRQAILRDGHVAERLNPLQDGAVDNLFASMPAPEPGHHVLHWSVKSIPDQGDSDRLISFSVAR